MAQNSTAGQWKTEVATSVPTTEPQQLPDLFNTAKTGIIRQSDDVLTRYNMDGHANTATSFVIVALLAYIMVRGFRALQMRVNGGWMQAKRYYDDINAEFMALNARVSKALQLLVLYGRDGELTETEINQIKALVRKADVNGDHRGFCDTEGDRGASIPNSLGRGYALSDAASSSLGGPVYRGGLSGVFVAAARGLSAVVSPAGQGQSPVVRLPPVDSASP